MKALNKENIQQIKQRMTTATLFELIILEECVQEELQERGYK